MLTLATIISIASTISMFVWVGKDMERAIEVGLDNLKGDKKSRFYSKMMLVSLVGTIIGLAMLLNMFKEV